jgi:hypothetical protein
MLATEPPKPLPVLSVPLEQGDPDPALAGAVNDLYRACHLPPPAMLIARCGDEFVQLLWHDNRPLLGPVAGYGAARVACVSSSNRAAGLDEVPAVLRAAAEMTLGSMPPASLRRRRCCCRQAPR